jgi:hypothetical protein
MISRTVVNATPDPGSWAQIAPIRITSVKLYNRRARPVSRIRSRGRPVRWSSHERGQPSEPSSTEGRQRGDVTHVDREGWRSFSPYGPPASEVKAASARKIPPPRRQVPARELALAELLEVLEHGIARSKRGSDSSLGDD